MLPNALQYLYDIRECIVVLRQLTQTLSFDQFLQDAVIRLATERQLEIIGEAINQLSHLSPEVVERITNYQRIISLRNILVHAYSRINYEVLWDIIHTNLLVLESEVQALLNEAEGA